MRIMRSSKFSSRATPEEKVPGVLIRASFGRATEFVAGIRGDSQGFFRAQNGSRAGQYWNLGKDVRKGLEENCAEKGGTGNCKNPGINNASRDAPADRSEAARGAYAD